MIKFSRYIFIFTCINLMSSCSSRDLLSSTFFTSVSPLFELLQENKDFISRDLVNSIPYASALISFGTKQKSLVILGKKENSVNTWISADKIIFEEKNGIIIRTVGLPNDLFQKLGPKRYDYSEIIKKEQANSFYYSFRKPTLNNLKVETLSRFVRKENVSILGHHKELLLIEETLLSKKINWKRTNQYWVDPKSFFVWKSIQHLSPRLPPLIIEVTKKPAY